MDRLRKPSRETTVLRKSKWLPTIPNDHAMSRSKTTAEAHSVGQLARRWGVSVERVRQLIRDGHLPETFTIPASGRFGAIVKIPLSTVLIVEQEWTVSPDQARETPRRRRAAAKRLELDFKHFPELDVSAEHDAECREDVPRSGARNASRSS